MTHTERCPHCVIVAMVNRTNGFGGVYLECPDCGYYEGVSRKVDPYPTKVRKVKGRDGAVRIRQDRRHPGSKYGPRRAH